MLITTLKNHFWLIIILTLAFSLRAFQIGRLPSLNPDEAALGYNAYSLIQTGKDEHGASWPLHFKSFGDYKPGGYVYLAIPFIKILGLTPLAVRLPNLILSVVAICFLYRLINLLTNNKTLSLLTIFILSLQPWHLHFSRGAWESSVALSFMIIGLYYFYLAIKSPSSLHYSLFVINFSLSLYTYHSARLVAPLLALALVLIYQNNVMVHFKKVIIPLVIGLIICLPLAFSFLHTGGAARFNSVGLSADSGPLWRSNELLNHHANTKLLNRVIHNRRLLYTLAWAQKYFSHFDLNFLFVNGDEVPRSRSPEMGQLYLLELPLLIVGFLSLIFSRIYDQKSKIFLLCWLAIAPIASSLTFQAPSALRALPLSVPLAITTALGLYTIFKFIKTLPRLVWYIAIGILTVSYGYSLGYYLDSYFLHAPKRYPFAWNSGFDSAVKTIETQKTQFDYIYFTPKYDQPYILYLFFSHFPPARLQPQIKLTPPDQFGFSTVAQIDNIHFQPLNWSQIPPKSLIIAADEITDQTPVATINFPNNQPGFKIFHK
jgi:4-amino-4-deoxy-L-arabinose transferase-like glycosyltransferase